MKRMIWAALAAPITLVALPAHAASPFDGTWKADIHSAQLSRKPDEYLLQNGVYTCKTCTPPYSVKADGAFHAVTGQPYFDSASVKIDDAHSTTETDRKGQKVISISTATVSPDGKTLNFSFQDMSAASGKAVTGKGVQTLVTPGPKGSHATSGAWRTEKLYDISDGGITIMLKDSGKALTLTTPTGINYTAVYGGPEVAVQGDTGGTKAAVTKPDAHTIVETDSRDGKTVSVFTMKLQADGSIMATSENKQRGTSSSFKLAKQ